MGYTLSLTHEGTWISGKDYQRDGLIGDLPIAESELRDRQFAQIKVIEPLTMIDLRDDGVIKMGVPTDVAKSSRQSLLASGLSHSMNIEIRSTASFFCQG